MLRIFTRDPVKTYNSAKQHALSHYERKHQRRALFQFKRAAHACPQRASEIGQFYYDNGDYKHAVYFYEACIKAGGAPPQTYRRAAKAYEKCARVQPWDYNDCMSKARTYRALSPHHVVATPMPALEAPKRAGQGA